MPRYLPGHLLCSRYPYFTSCHKLFKSCGSFSFILFLEMLVKVAISAENNLCDYFQKAKKYLLANNIDPGFRFSYNLCTFS